MTSPALVRPLQAPTANAAAPARQAPASSLRRAARSVLIIGTVLAVGAAFGPAWTIRVGVVIALVAAVVACVLAWGELASARRAHARDMLTAARDHGQALSAERTHTASVLDTLTERAKAAGAEISRQQTVIGGLRVEISTLRGDNAFLQGEIKHRESVITALRETVRAREAELIALRDEGEDAEIHALPRRVLAEHRSAWDALPDAHDLWSDGSHPTVVDLLLIDTALIDTALIDTGLIDTGLIDTAMVLPNYEEDRRFA